MSKDLFALEDRLLAVQERLDVLAKKFDPNQPRDEEGKWTDGAGTAVTGAIRAVVPRSVVREASQQDWARWTKRALMLGGAVLVAGGSAYVGYRIHQDHGRILALAAKDLGALGVDPNSVKVRWTGPLGLFGKYTPSTGEIHLFPMNIKVLGDVGETYKRTIRTTIAHEGMHRKAFAAFGDAKIKQWLNNNFINLVHEGVAAKHQVSNYSGSFWAKIRPDIQILAINLTSPRAKRNKFLQQIGMNQLAKVAVLPIHETLAEMSAVKQRTGKLPGGPLFQELHGMVMNHGRGNGFVMVKREEQLEDRVLILQDQLDVLAKKFDPNQKRDKDGKWSETGAGGGKSPEPSRSGKTTSRLGLVEGRVKNKNKKAWNKWVKRALIGAGVLAAVGGAAYGARVVRQKALLAVAKEMAELGVDPKIVNVNWLTSPVKLQMGSYNLNTKKINVFPLRNALQGLLGDEKGGVQGFFGTLVHEGTHAKSFPAFESKKMQFWALRNLTELSKEGGVTNYSKKFWYMAGLKPEAIAVKGGGREIPNWELAIHETLAEMSAVKRRTGKLPGGPKFQELHAMIMEGRQPKVLGTIFGVEQ